MSNFIDKYYIYKFFNWKKKIFISNAEIIYNYDGYNMLCMSK